MNDRRLDHDEAGALRQHRRPAEEDNEPQAHPLHRLNPTPRQLETGELRQTGSDSDGSGGKQVARERVDHQKQDRRQEVAEQLPERMLHRCLPFVGRPPETLPGGNRPAAIFSQRVARLRLSCDNVRVEDVILETRGLTKEFRGFTAVQGVDLKIRRGTIHALIGPNGAGKTTVFNLLTKFLDPSAGEILYNGRDITALRPAEIARRGMVRSFQISAVFPHLSVRENVRIALQHKLASSFHFWRSGRVLDHRAAPAEALLDAVGLSGFGDELASELAYGRKRALEIATTLALDPEMLLLDEPMAGLGQEEIGRISALIRRVSADRTILMVEHNLSVVADLSNTITVLTRGRILTEGDYATVSKDPEVVEAYLGTGHA